MIASNSWLPTCELKVRIEIGFLQESNLLRAFFLLGAVSLRLRRDALPIACVSIAFLQYLLRGDRP